MDQADLLILKEIKNRTRRGFTQEQGVKIYNIYLKYVDNKASACLGCGDKDIKRYFETLEQLYLQPKHLTVNDASFKLNMKQDYINKDLCAFCGSNYNLVETEVANVPPNIKVKVCKTNCGYEKK